MNMKVGIVPVIVTTFSVITIFSFLSRILAEHGINVYEDVSSRSIRSAWYCLRYSPEGREMKVFL